MRRLSIRGQIGWVGPALLAGMLAAGCSSSGPTAPVPAEVDWEALELLSSAGPDTLSINGEGLLRFPAAGALDALMGVVGPERLGELRAASAGIAWGTLAGVPVDPPSANWVIRTQDGQRRGFSWSMAGELPAEQEAMAALLEQIRAEVLGEGSERVETIPTTRLLRGEDARVAAARAEVVRDEDGLLSLLREALGGAPVVIPEVDFGRDMVLAVFAGALVGPGTRIEIGRQVSRTAGGYVQVAVTLHEPAPECAGSVVERPYDLVCVRRSDLEIFFTWDRVLTGCTGE